MSLHDQALSIAQAGSAMRIATYGSTAVMQDVAGITPTPPTFQCQFTKSIQNEQLLALGISGDIDLLLRVPKTQTNFNPTIGKNVVIYNANDDGSSATVRLDTTHSHPFNPEYIFGCKAIW